MARLFKSVVIMMIMFSSLHTLSADEVRSSDIHVTNAFFYVPVGASKTTTAFFTITNHSNSDIRITGVSSVQAGQMALMPEPVLIVPAHQSVTLKSGGPYLQINGLKGRLSTGDELHLRVNLSNGRSLELVALAKSAYDQVHGH